MRKKYEPQLSIDIIPIPEVKIPDNSRDELPPVLKGLQYIYCNAAIRDEIFQYLEVLVFPENNHTGRPGISLWEILVLGVVHLCLDADYDRIEYLSNYDKLLRSILGVEAKFSEPKIYDINTIKSNIHKIDAQSLEKINAIINLLWDANRKCIMLTKKLVAKYDYRDWRKIEMWYRQLKNQYRDASKKVFVRSYSEENRKESVRNYLQTSRSILQKIERPFCRKK